MQRQSVRGSVLAVALAAIGAQAACTQSQPSAPEPAAVAADEGTTIGTVSFTGGAVAAGIGFQWGSGTLTFRGMQYPFRVRGISVIDVGLSRVTGTGRVRNLRNVPDFSGNYVAASAGATLAGGAGAIVLQNQNGVVIEGISTSQGARLTLAPSGVNITLTQQ